MATLHETLLAPADDRFEPSNRAAQPAAAASWREAYRDTVEAVNELVPGESAVLLTGNMAAFNVNQVDLDSRLHGLSINLDVPETSAPMSVQEESLAPTTPGRPPPRALISVDHDRLRLPADVRRREFVARAEQSGWTTAERIPLPHGDQIRILLPPGSVGPS